MTPPLKFPNGPFDPAKPTITPGCKQSLSVGWLYSILQPLHRCNLNLTQRIITQVTRPIFITAGDFLCSMCSYDRALHGGVPKKRFRALGGDLWGTSFLAGWEGWLDWEGMSVGTRMSPERTGNDWILIVQQNLINTWRLE